MKSWFVVYTKPRQESVAEKNLHRQGFQTYLPWLGQPCRRRNQWVDAVAPMFPRYFFVQIDTALQSVAPIRSTCGVTSLVTFGSRLLPVADDVIDVLRQSGDAKSGLHKLPEPQVKKGDIVTVMSGPFQGLRGVFESPSGKERVLILLDVLGTTSSINLQRSHVAAG